jgi:hypothetical protein
VDPSDAADPGDPQGILNFVARLRLDFDLQVMPGSPFLFSKLRLTGNRNLCLEGSNLLFTFTAKVSGAAG